MNHRRRKGHAIRAVIMTHQLYRAEARIGFVSNKYIPSRSRDLVHVLALQLVQLSECGYHQVNYN